MRATITGIACCDKKFNDKWKFKVIPPKKGTSYYGTGKYISAEMNGLFYRALDIRYDNRPVDVIVYDFLQNYYGEIKTCKLSYKFKQMSTVHYATEGTAHEGS